MRESVSTTMRRRVGYGLLVFCGASLVWYLMPGVPVLRAPSASAETINAGRALFEHEWQPYDPLAHSGDGLGPVFNGKSCAQCHFQGGVGGGGSSKRNVNAFVVHPTVRDPEVKTGVVHAFAVGSQFQETPALLGSLYPIVKGGTRVVSGCSVVIQDFNPVEQVSINTTALFGAGWLDRISTQSVLLNYRSRSVSQITAELGGNFTGVGAGRLPSLPDGRIGKFGWKGQFATLKEFVATACAVEVGLGNPLKEQASPLGRSEPTKSEPDLDADQFAALVAFVDTLPRPVRILPDDPALRSEAATGERLFNTVGCAVCHVPSLGGVEGVYSDLLLYDLEDREAASHYASATNEAEWPRDLPRPEEWKTPPLWGVADSAPYFHDGASPDLPSAIERHKGAAAPVTARYRQLNRAEQAAIVTFLKTLRAPRPVETVARGPGA